MELEQQLVEEEAARIRNVDQWPFYPVLPMKKFDGELGLNDFAVLVHNTALHQYLLYVDAPWLTQADMNMTELLIELGRRTPDHRYTDETIAEVMTQHGWIVD